MLTMQCRFGRDSFQETVKLSRRVDQSSLAWDRFRYMVYDIPTHKGAYEERYTELGEPFFYATFPV